MSSDGLMIVSVTDLMRAAGAAHGEAFDGANGKDPDWPLWYANYLFKPMREFGMELTRSRLVYCLMDAEYERVATAPDADWPRFYAEHFVERYRRSETPEQDKLALYYTPWCPYCHLVREVIDELGVDVELRDIESDSHHHQELVAARQRATVPVLRITSPSGDSRWMPESSDIISLLEKNYARSTAEQ
jgi:glutaredoxin